MLSFMSSNHGGRQEGSLTDDADDVNSHVYSDDYNTIEGPQASLRRSAHAATVRSRGIVDVEARANNTTIGHELNDSVFEHSVRHKSHHASADHHRSSQMGEVLSSGNSDPLDDAHADLAKNAKRYRKLMAQPFAIHYSDNHYRGHSSVERQRAAPSENPTPDQEPAKENRQPRPLLSEEQGVETRGQELPPRQRKHAVSSVGHPRDPHGARTAFSPALGFSFRERGDLGSNDVFTVGVMTPEDIKRERQELVMKKIRNGLRIAKLNQRKSQNSTREIKEKLKRIEEEAELVFQLRQIHTPLPSARPFSACLPEQPQQPQHQRLASAPTVAAPLPSIEVVRRHSACAQGKRDGMKHRSPFFTTAQPKDHVSFSLPANGQQVLGAVKRNYPSFVGMAKQILGNPKYKKEQVAENFLGALERRAELIERAKQRLEASLRTATGERVAQLRRDSLNRSRQLQQCMQRIEALRKELECCGVEGEDGSRAHHVVAGNSMNQLKMLQRVFEQP